MAANLQAADEDPEEDVEELLEEGPVIEGEPAAVAADNVEAAQINDAERDEVRRAIKFAQGVVKAKDRRLVDQLDDKDADRRKEAHRKIVRLKFDIVPALKMVIARTKNEELKKRYQSAVDEIGKK